MCSSAQKKPRCAKDPVGAKRTNIFGPTPGQFPPVINCSPGQRWEAEGPAELVGAWATGTGLAGVVGGVLYGGAQARRGPTTAPSLLAHHRKKTHDTK